MGGCASKPKDSNGQNPPENPPAENPSAPEPISKSVEPDNNTSPTEVKVEAQESQKAEKETKEEPLVDHLTEPKLDALSLEGNSSPAEPKTTAVEESVPIITEAKSDAPQILPRTDLEDAKQATTKQNPAGDVSDTHHAENGTAAVQDEKVAVKNASTENSTEEKAGGAADLVVVKKNRDADPAEKESPVSKTPGEEVSVQSVAAGTSPAGSA